MDRRCGRCRAILRSTGGAERHEIKCKRKDEIQRQSNPQKRRRRRDKNEPVRFDHQTADDGFDDTLEIANRNRQISSEDEGFVLRNNGAAIITADGISTPLSNDQVICCEVPTMEASINQPNPPPRERGLLSTATSVRIEGYMEVTGRGAGEPVQYCATKDETWLYQQCPNPPDDGGTEFHPFQSEAEYALALFFVQEKVSQGAIDRFLRDPRLAPLLQDQISVKNSNDLFRRYNQLNQGIVPEKWEECTLHVNKGKDSMEQTEYYIQYRSIVQVLRFLLGHRPFAPNLTYAPVRLFNDDNSRMYTEVHTGNRWWHQQDQLPPGATVVPLVIATDKTLLSEQGEITIYPVYASVFNLDSRTRHAQKRPGTVLLGFIPVTKGQAKSEVYHTAMELMLAPLEMISKTGIYIACADGKMRVCYPIISSIMADYEEQVVITGVKNLRQCTICQIPPDQRENLQTKWKFRDHISTKQQIELQSRRNIKQSDDAWVHPRQNFAWKHHLVNIHTCMTPDILHQLMKGTATDLIDWTKNLLLDNAKLRRSKGQLKWQGSTEDYVDAVLNERFSQIPEFVGMKRFKEFTSVSQWTGHLRKDMMRQLVAVLAPLIPKEHTGAMLYARAVSDFTMLAQYASHDDNTIGYMEHALYIMDQTKTAFSDFRPLHQATQERHFNIPKLHALTHYPYYIREIGSLTGVDVEHGEVMHKLLVKAFFNRTNKRSNYQEQLLHHNTRYLQMMAMEELRMLKVTKPLSLADITEVVHATTPTRPVDLTDMGWFINQDDRYAAEEAGIPIKIWRRAYQVENETGLSGFIEALAVFLRENRNKQDRTSTTNIQMDRREEDSSKVGSYFVCIHNSVQCWKRDGKNLDSMAKEFIRCAYNWQNQGEWRRDHVWVQEHTQSATSGQIYPLSGMLPGKAQLIITVIDKERLNSQGRRLQYTGVLVDLLRLKDMGRVNDFHGMVEVEPWQQSLAKCQRSIGGRRIYDLSLVLRSAHIVPSKLGSEPQSFVINPWVDFDQFNTLYDEDFLLKGKQAANKYAKSQSRKRKA